MPTRELCALGAEFGAHVHVDGAQSWGSLAQQGCQSFAASSHKWFMGPIETGVLFVRPEAIAEQEGTVQKIWPSVFGYDYKIQVPVNELPPNASRFELLGQRDEPNLCAMLATVGLHSLIGADAIERRVASLARELKQRLVEIGEEVITPMDDELSHGVVMFRVGDEYQGLYDYLYENGIAGSSNGTLKAVRLCPHIYNTDEHIAKAVRLVEQWRQTNPRS